MARKENTIFIKNMVCDRCILSVGRILDDLKIPYKDILLGEVILEKEISEANKIQFEKELKKIGFERIESRLNKTIEDTKKAIIEYIKLGEKIINLSTFISQRIPYDYSYLSDLFSTTEGKSIEQFFILQRVEKVKELMFFEELSLTQIAYDLGYSSVHHLSAQFKKTTGLTPLKYKQSAVEKRKPIDKV